jgi:hypothetical protein
MEIPWRFLEIQWRFVEILWKLVEIDRDSWRFHGDSVEIRRD